MPYKKITEALRLLLSYHPLLLESTNLSSFLKLYMRSIHLNFCLVCRIADMKYKVNITGSNSKMLSSEIASTLGGRFVIMNVYPYSFAEYLVADGKKKNYLDTISTSDKA